MGSARDSSPNPRRADSPVCSPLSARAHIYPVSAITPLAASTPGRTPPESSFPRRCAVWMPLAGEREGALLCLPLSLVGRGPMHIGGDT